MRLMNQKMIDYFYSIVEHYSSKLNAWAWNKRWCSRKKGTGYKK
jgi:hypothetical protein